MATGYGSYISGDWRGVVEATVVNTSATVCTVTVKGKCQSVYATASYMDGRVTTNASGSWSSWTDYFAISPGNTTTFLTKTFTVTRTDSAQSVTCKAASRSNSGSSWGQQTSTASVTVTIPAIQYSAPNAPSSCSATRNSDTKATVTWTNGATDTTHPRTATLIERSTNGGTWTQLASLGSSVVNYTDYTISANHRYAYRVRAQNSAGYSSYSTSGYIYTTPAAPTAVNLTKSATTTVSVNATVSAPYATGFDVARSQNSGSTWTQIASNSSLPVSDTVTGTVRYRVRSVRSTLASAWKSSTDITTVVAPNAPTITAKPSTPTLLGNSVTIKWTPNHPDGTAQSKAQVLLTDPNGTSSTVTINGATSTYSFTPNATGTWSAKVRTYGLSVDAGAYSSSFSWGVHVAPVVTIDAPATDGTTISTMPMAISWSITDATGVSSQKVTIDGGGSTVYSKAVASGTATLVLSAADVPLADDTDYSITLYVVGGSGLSATAVRTFHVDWLLPAAPTATIVEGENVSATIEVGAEAGDAVTESISVARLLDDGTEWVISEGMSDGESCIDPLPPIGSQVTYRVTAYAASGASASTTYSEIFTSDAWILNFGSTANDAVEFLYNPQASYSLAHGGASYHFADGGAGNGLPVWYGTTDRDESGSLSFDNVMNANTDRLRDLCTAYPVAWLRDPFGHRWRAHVRPNTSHGIGRIWASGIDWDAVRFREAW